MKCPHCGLETTANRRCSITGCSRRYFCRGLCARHYRKRIIKLSMGEPESAAQMDGLAAEERVANLLISNGRKVSITPYNCPYDLLVDGKKVEVKSSGKHPLRNGFVWLYNLHRHGVLNESEVDLYVFEMKDFQYPYVLIPAPIGKKSISLNYNILAKRYFRGVEDFNRFCSGSY